VLFVAVIDARLSHLSFRIPDPNAQKPEDWDDVLDGEWIPPMIRT
jgi:hypothetical protein